MPANRGPLSQPSRRVIGQVAHPKFGRCRSHAWCWACTTQRCSVVRLFTSFLPKQLIIILAPHLLLLVRLTTTLDDCKGRRFMPARGRGEGAAILQVTLR